MVEMKLRLQLIFSQRCNFDSALFLSNFILNYPENEHLITSENLVWFINFNHDLKRKNLMRVLRID